MKYLLSILLLSLLSNQLYSQYVFRFTENRADFLNDIQSGPVPKWSPQGDKLAFINKVGNKRRIGILASDSIIYIEGAQNEFEWSHDGNSIVYTAKKGKILKAFQYFLSSNETVPVSSNGIISEFYPKFSPNDSIIAYYVYDMKSPSQLFFSINGQAKKLSIDTTADFLHPSWSPSGEHLLYTRDDRKLISIHIMDFKSKQIIFDMDFPDYEFLDWIPEGSEILVAKGKQLLRVNFLTGEIKTIAEFPHNILGGKWSGQANMIVVSLGDKILEAEENKIFVVSPDGLVKKEIATGQYAAWHPIERKIIFVGNDPYKCPLYEIGSSGENLRLIYDGKKKRRKK